MNLQKALRIVHLVLALLFLVFALFGPWAKRPTGDHGALSSDGGSGFGLVAVVLGVCILALAVMRFFGYTHVLPGLGVEQLTVVLGIAATLTLIGFVVGWLAVFPAGTGWAIVAAYFPASLIPQVGMLTLSAREPARGIQPLTVAQRRTNSGLALVFGLAVIFLPFLTWLSSGSVSLAAFDGRAGNPTSGPRLAYILLVVGAIVVVAAAMRLRPQGLAEPGANLLHSHALFAAGFTAAVLPLATLISVARKDGLSAGIGLWLSLLAGALLIALALVEQRERHAVGT